MYLHVDIFICRCIYVLMCNRQISTDRYRDRDRTEAEIEMMITYTYGSNQTQVLFVISFSDHEKLLLLIMYSLFIHSQNTLKVVTVFLTNTPRRSGTSSEYRIYPWLFLSLTLQYPVKISFPYKSKTTMRYYLLIPVES